MLNKESVYSILSVSFKILSGPIAIILITTKLSLEEQGVYYMFLSLSAIQWVFELGISTCMVQYISAARSKNEKERYFSFLTLFLFLAAVVLIISLSISGEWFFNSIPKDIWVYPWFVYLLFVSLNLFFNILVLFQESSGSIASAYLTKMFSGIGYSAALILTLFFGAGLYSLAIAQFFMLLIVVYRERKQLIVFKYVYFNKSLIILTAKEIFGFQYKLSIIWIVGYFYWNSFQVLFFKFVSPEWAGLFGATNGIFGAFTLMSTSLVSTQRSRWGRLNEDGRIEETYYIFKRETIKGILLYLILSLFVITFIMLFPTLPFVNRFLPIGFLALFAGFRLFVTYQEIILNYLRTFKDEPLYKITLVNYLSLPIAVFLGVYMNNLYMIFVLSIILQLIFSLIYTLKMNEYIKNKVLSL